MIKENNIDTLIAQLCPNRVEFRELGEIGDFYGGLSGKNKNDFQGGNAKYVTYMNIFSNIALKTIVNDFVIIGENENQNRIEYGDVLFTGSSETPDECGMSSVVTEKIAEPLYLNSFCFGFRLQDKDLFLPDFLKYLFRDDNIRKQIGQTASGVTRFNVSKKRFAKVTIPLPPLPIQQVIVNILDKFTQLEAELQAELQARRAQYEYYRNELLNFEGKDVEWKMLGEVSKILRGTAITEKETIFGEFPVVANAPNPIYFHGKSNRSGETIVIARSGAYSGLVSYWNKPFFLTDAFSIHPDNNLIKTKFVYFFLKTDQKKIHLMKKGSGVPHVRANDFESYSIPVPPLSEQERIVAILDKFDKLVNSKSEGLPAEILARRKQYEYYRGKLLDFKSA